MKLRVSYLGWVFGLGLVIYLLRHINLREVGAALSHLSWTSVAGVLCFTLIANSFQGLRFHWLWPSGRIPVRRMMLLPFCVHSANILLPFRAGETVQPLTLKKWAPHQKFSSLLKWAVTDKAIEMISFLPFVAAAAWVFNYYAWAATAVALAVNIGLFVWAYRTKDKPRSMVRAYLCSIIHWCFNGMVFFSLMPQLKSALGLLVGTTSAASIPAVPGSMGTYEAGFVFVGSKVGIGQANALALALAGHSLSILVTLTVGLSVGAVWGWPNKRDQIEAQPQVMPLSQKISNIVVYIVGLFTLIFSCGLWIPKSMMPKKPPQPRGRHRVPHRGRAAG